MSNPFPTPLTPPRVVIADDSPFMRRILEDALTRRGFQVVAVAGDGDEALAACREHRPDVLSLDLAMPGTDGIGVLKELRRSQSPVPVVVVSAFSPAHGARAVDALAEGAVDLVAKPSAGVLPEVFFGELVTKLRLAAATRRTVARPAAPRVPAPVRARPATSRRRGVMIACSTGGPKALAELLPALPAKVGDGCVVVQHMPAGFTASLAQRLDRACSLSVHEAQGGEQLSSDTVWLAPGGHHLRLAEGGRITLSDEPEVGGLRPRADLTIRDAAALYGEGLLLVVLTGMGKDGLDGAREVKRLGGRVAVEAESSCTVYGMPRAISEAGLADHELPLCDLADAIVQEAGA